MASGCGIEMDGASAIVFLVLLCMYINNNVLCDQFFAPFGLVTCDVIKWIRWRREGSDAFRCSSVSTCVVCLHLPAKPASVGHIAVLIVSHASSPGRLTPHNPCSPAVDFGIFLNNGQYS